MYDSYSIPCKNYISTFRSRVDRIEIKHFYSIQKLTPGYGVKHQTSLLLMPSLHWIRNSDVDTS